MYRATSLCVQERLDSGVYVTLELFRAELGRIWANARVYNEEGTVFVRAANSMQRLCDELFLSTLHPHG